MYTYSIIFKLLPDDGYINGALALDTEIFDFDVSNSWKPSLYSVYLTKYEISKNVSSSVKSKKTNHSSKK